MKVRCFQSTNESDISVMKMIANKPYGDYHISIYIPATVKQRSKYRTDKW